MIPFDRETPNCGGTIEPTLSSVGDAFDQNFKTDADVGAAFAVYVDGHPIVDIYAGFTENTRQNPWTRDTIVGVYSTGKAILAMFIARAVSQGLIDYDAPVARYWPEFAVAGKQDVTVAQALSHQAGLCAVPEDTQPQTWFDREAITNIVAQMNPLWEPGTSSGYHPQTFGIIGNELLRRATGETIGTHLRKAAGDLDLNIYCGMDDAEIARAAKMKKPSQPPDLGAMTDLKRKAFLSPSSNPGGRGYEDWLRAEFPAANTHADARSIAAITQPMATGGHTIAGEAILNDDALDGLFVERCHGDDLVLPFQISWCAGIMRNVNHHYGPNKNAFGHAGFGGSFVLIDPQNKLTAAYVTNRMSHHLVGDPRGIRLVEATYAAAGF